LCNPNLMPLRAAEARGKSTTEPRSTPYNLAKICHHTGSWYRGKYQRREATYVSAGIAADTTEGTRSPRWSMRCPVSGGDP
jgi:hypothetical protein